MLTRSRLLLVALIVAGVIAPDRASALPAFARRYETSCTTCHVFPPKLNGFGVAFRNNGYHVPGGDEQFVKQPDVALGAPAWKRVWPKAIWPGSIPDRIPLSAGVEMVTDFTPSEPVATNFAFPEEVELMAAGTFGDHLSYLGDLTFAFGEETEVDFERGHFDMRLGPTQLAHLRLGRLDIGANPFSHFWYRLTDADFIVADFRAHPGGFRFSDRQQGLEFWGAATGKGGGGIQYSAGVVNGTGTAPDENSAKDVYGAVSYKLGGYGVTGNADPVDSLKSTDNFADRSLEIGAFGYKGWAGPAGDGQQPFSRAGAKVSAYLGRLNVFGAYVRGRDERADASALSTDAWFVEGDLVTYPWIVAIVRYDQASGEREFLRLKRIVPAVSLMIRANVLLSVEGNLYTSDWNVLDGEALHDSALVRFVFLF